MLGEADGFVESDGFADGFGEGSLDREGMVEGRDDGILLASTSSL